MGIARSTYYGAPAADRDAEIVARIEAICAEFEAYGYRRVTAELRHQGQLVNSKRVRRLMREHGLSPKQRRRYVTTTDSDHDEPIFPNLAADMAPDGPTSCGWRTSPTSPLRPASSTSPRSWMPGHAGLSATRSAARSMPVSPSRRSTRRFAHGRRPRAACITATAARNTRLSPTGSCLPSTSSRARWAGGEIPTTTCPCR